MSQIYYPLRPFEKEIYDELDVRRSSRPGNEEKIPYLPRMGWARVASLANVTFKGQSSKNGFVLHSNNGFDKMYGFGSPDNKQSGIIGYTVSGMEHRISDMSFVDLKRPPPGITSITSELHSGEGKFVEATFTFRCNDQYQFKYMSPFFMTPGVTICMEWGWADRAPANLVPLNDMAELKRIRGNWNIEQEKRLDSSGNYEMVLGMVTKYDFSLKEDGGYECTVEVRSLGYSIYGLTNSNESMPTDCKETVDKKASSRIPKLILSYLEGGFKQFGKDWILMDEINGQPPVKDLSKATRNMSESHSSGARESRGFSSNIIEKSNSNFHSKINKKDGWISFGLFISLLNAEKSFNFKNGDGNDEVFKIDISRSWISAHPNIKSVDGEVLLIPNAYAPAFPVEDDNIEKLSDGLLVNDFKFIDADKALEKVNGSIKQKRRGYTGELTRVNLANIICAPRLDNGETLKTCAFPDPELGYTGHISNLYINKTIIDEALNSTHLTIHSIYDILRKISTASGNIWDFEIIAHPDNKTQLTLIDSNFPGFDENGNLSNVKTIKEKSEFYTFSTIENNSIVRSLDFSVSLSEEIATQTMMTGQDSNVSRDDEKFFQRSFSDTDGEVLIEDELHPLAAKNEKTNADGSQKTCKESGDSKDSEETQKGVEPLNDEEYFIVEIDTGKNNVVVRLVEPNVELVQTAGNLDNDHNNSARFNGLVQGITIDLALTGISGIRFMDVFDIDNLPYPYNPNAIFQVTNVKHSWSNNDWITNISAMIRPSPEMFT